MSRKSRKEQQVKNTLRQAPIIMAKSPEGTGVRPSVGQLVLQRMDKLRATPLIDPLKPSIKLIDTAAVSKTLPDTTTKEDYPECPTTCSPLEWKRAIQNKEHYEANALKDGNKKPWFQYPKHEYQYSEFVYCTPDMMREVMKFMPVNRKFKESWSDTIARDILNDRWLQTHESIAINTLGNMHDGQHRANGLIKADKGWPIYFTWNVPPEALYVTDSGEKRNINEKLNLLFPEAKMNHKTAALCRAMMWGLENRGVRYSESEIALFAIKYHDVTVWTQKNFRDYRADLQAVIAKGLLWWGEEIIKPFVDRLNKVEFTGDGDPAKALYIWLTNARQQVRRTQHSGPVLYYKKALAALQAHVDNRKTNKVIQVQNDIFEWQSEWEMPEGAPCAGKIFLPEEPEVPAQAVS